MLHVQRTPGTLSDKDCKEISFHPEYNALFDLPGFNPGMNPSCRMHSCDQGIFKKILDMVVQQIKTEPISIIREFESRCAKFDSFTTSILSQMGRIALIPWLSHIQHWRTESQND